MSNDLSDPTSPAHAATLPDLLRRLVDAYAPLNPTTLAVAKDAGININSLYAYMAEPGRAGARTPGYATMLDLVKRLRGNSAARARAIELWQAIQVANAAEAAAARG
jgi:hypothetical protein